jgi:hypothetical protein
MPRYFPYCKEAKRKWKPCREERRLLIFTAEFTPTALRIDAGPRKMVSARYEGWKRPYEGPSRTARRTASCGKLKALDARKIQHVEKAVKRLCVKPYSFHNLYLRTGCLGDEKARELRSGI